MLDVTDKDIFSKVAKSILDAISRRLDACGLDAPGCQFVGFNRPPEISCPDLVAWAGNIRPWDGNTMDSGLINGQLGCFNLWAFDVTVRLGLCYIDFDESGNNLQADIQEDMSAIMYQYGHVLSVGFISAWRNGQVMELGACDPFNVGPLIDFKEGGCGGWEMTFSVGLM